MNNKTTPDTIQLQEVVVTASKPLSKIEGDGFVTSVQGTILQNLGTAKDVLGYIPGIQNNNGKIEVIGKGSPAIYINGKILRTEQELDQLRSDKIKEVKLISNPGARYGGDVSSVIKIQTVKNVGEGFALNSRSSLQYRDFFGVKEDLAMNYRINSFDIFGNFAYTFNKGKGSATNIQNTWTQNHYLTYMNMYAAKRTNFYDGKIGFNYQPSSNQSFGIYYQISHQPSRTNSKYDYSSSQNDTLIDKSILNETKPINFTEHLIDAYYNGKFGKWEVDASLDILLRNNCQNQIIIEKSDISKLMETQLTDKSRGRMIAGELNASRKLGQGTIDFGGAYSNSNRQDNFTGDKSLIEDNDNRINEGDFGLYANYSLNLKRISLQAGLRYEHIYSNYYEFDRKMPDQCRKYNEFLPSLNLVIPIKKSVVQLGYSRKYTRPLYSQLSSTVVYVNQFLYESGNPYLKSSFSDNVSLNFRWKWFMFMGSYKHTSNQIISSASSYNGYSDITLLRKENSPYDLNSIQAIASIVPGMIGGIYYPVLTFGAVTQFYKVDYLDEIKDMNRPMPIVQFSNLFRLPKNFTVSANFRWRGKGDSENISMDNAVWQLDLSIQKIFGKHWNVKLSANDIFNTSKNNNFTIFSGVRKIMMMRINTSRNFDLTVEYKFNVTPSKYKGKGTGQDEKDRLK